MRKVCKNCQKVFEKKPNENSKYWATKKYCSTKCYGLSKKGITPPHVKLWEKGDHISPSTEFKKGQTSARKGVKQPQTKEHLEKRINALARGAKHWNWKGGITPKNDRVRKSLQYKKWRMLVFQRDRFSCVNCGHRSHGGDIRADHIKPFSLYPQLRFDLDNGRTLCLDCDAVLGWNYNRARKESPDVVGQNL